MPPALGLLAALARRHRPARRLWATDEHVKGRVRPSSVRFGPLPTLPLLCSEARNCIESANMTGHDCSVVELLCLVEVAPFL